MKFQKKALPPREVDRNGGCCGKQQWPEKMVDQAFKYYMQVDDKLERKYSFAQIVAALHKDFPEITKGSKLSPANVSYWARFYDWKVFLQQAVDKATAATDDLIERVKCFDEEAAGMIPKLGRMRRFAKFVNNRELQAASVDRLAPTIAAYVIDLVNVNQLHYRRLMLTRNGDNLVYDCDQHKTRTQLFDMWMSGVNKVMEVYGVIAKRVTSKTIVTDANGRKTGVETITTQGGDAPMTTAQYDEALRLIGLEQLRGGFGSELTGPDNSKFPSKPGDPDFIPQGQDGTDPESSEH